MPERDAWLGRVEAALPFIAEQRGPVIEELRGHLDDSERELVADGWEPVAAAEEALRRMGDPDEVARDIGRAQQTRRRLALAAGAGVMNLGGSLLGAFVLLLPAGILAGLVLILATAVLGNFAVSGTQGPFYLTVTLWVVAAVAGIRLPVALARASRRPIAWGRRVAMVAFVPSVAFWVIAVAEAPHDLATMVAFLATPVIAWLAIRRSGRPMPGLTLRRAWLVLAVLIGAAIVADAAMPDHPGDRLVDGSPRDDGDAAAMHLGLVGSLDLVEDGNLPGFGWSGNDHGFEVHVVRRPNQAARFPRLSAELWPATPDLTSIHPDATGPFVAVDLRPGRVLEWSSLTLLGGRFLLSPHEDRNYRGIGRKNELLVGTLPTTDRLDWGDGAGWVVLVSTDEDGNRSVLRWSGYSSRLGFRGTILDWLRADRSPAPIGSDGPRGRRTTETSLSR